MLSIISNNMKMVQRSLIVGACAIVCLSIFVQAQYNTFDSDSNSDSEGGPILTQAELGRLVRNSAKARAFSAGSGRRDLNQQQSAAATRNLYNKHQSMQFAPSHNRRRNYANGEGLNDFGPNSGAASNTRGSNSEFNDDDEGSNFGPNFGNEANENEGENSALDGDGPALNLNQAASGHPQGDYSANNDGAAYGLGLGGFGGSNLEGAEFGPSEGYGSEGRRAKSASSPLGSRNFDSEDDAGAPLYGPNSAVNSDDVNDEGRANVEGGDNDNDDE